MHQTVPASASKLTITSKVDHPADAEGSILPVEKRAAGLRRTLVLAGFHIDVFVYTVIFDQIVRHADITRHGKENIMEPRETQRYMMTLLKDGRSR